MTEYMTIGERIRHLRGPESREEFCPRFFVSKQTLIRYEHDQTTPNAEFIKSLCQYYAVSSDWIIFGSAPKMDTDKPINVIKDVTDQNDYVNVPLVAAELAAGAGSLVDSSQVLGEFQFKRAWLITKGSLKDLVVMRIFGDSMEPTLKNNDYALINLDQTKPHNGCLYAIAHDDALYIKRIVVEPGRLIMRSDNKQYGDIIISYEDQATMDKVKIIGRAVWWCHDERS